MVVKVSMRIIPIFLCFLFSWSTVTSGEEKERDTKPLSVLLISGYFPGHLFSVVSLGEELVKRGHNVTLCTTVMEGSHLLPKVPERVGIKFVSAGPDNMTVQMFESLLQQIQGGFDLKIVRKWTIMTMWTNINIRKALDKLGVNQFDIIICDFTVTAVGVYYAMQSSKVIMYAPFFPYVTATIPQWPFSPYSTGNPTFVDRLVSIFLVPLSVMAIRDFFAGISSIDKEYGHVVQDTDVTTYPGIHIPLFITTTFGFDCPKTQTPLTHYIGPVLMGTLPPLDPDIKEWLNEKKERSVIYISMGTTSSLTVDMARAIIGGVLATDYDAVWALRKSKRDILDGIKIYHNRIYLLDWGAQQTILTHPTIALTLVHCGMNGVQESLYNSLPVICIPNAFDHYEIAASIKRTGVGVPLYVHVPFYPTKELTVERVRDAIQEVTSSNKTRENAAKIRKLFQHAGGAQRAANLVEFYEEVGYDHLIPAYAKYEWSWVQYYNVDVYCLLVAILTLWLYVSYRILKCCLRICCTGKKKTKQE